MGPRVSSEVKGSQVGSSEVKKVNYGQYLKAFHLDVPAFLVMFFLSLNCLLLMPEENTTLE